MKIGDRVIHPAHGEGEIRSLSPSKTMAVVRYPTSVEGQFYHRTHWINNLKPVVGVEEAPLECYVHGCNNPVAWVGRPPHFDHDVYVCHDERWRIQSSERRRLIQEPQNDGAYGGDEPG